MNKIPVIRFYFPLDALHVSDCVAPYSSQTMVPAYTKCDIQFIKVAPDDGLIQSETCGASNEKIKSNHKNSVHLVGLYTYCKMTHDT